MNWLKNISIIGIDYRKRRADYSLPFIFIPSIKKGLFIMSIKSLHIKNFTVFEDLELDFSPSINIFIGENGTGKTQILKMIYSCCEANNDIDKFRLMLADCFQVSNLNNIPLIKLDNNFEKSISSIFIPSKDMLTHSKGLLTMAELYSKSMPFDKTILDIIDRATRWHLNEVEPWIRCILTKLEEIIGGTVFERDGGFFVLNEDGKEISFSFEAEGVKKFGLLWLLLVNGSIDKDTTLIWDEPDANINPKFIPILVEILLELAKHGVQIFIATHDYYFPQYVEVFATENDIVKFHSLYETDNGIKCETNDKFSMLSHNDINNEANRLYDAEIIKVMQ